MKFRRKPVFVEAVQFDPEQKPWPPGVHEIKPHWSSSILEYAPPRYAFNAGTPSPIAPGDWVVTNQTGEQYVSTEASFLATFEPDKRV